MSHINSVLALRQRELLKSTKPFFARGSKVQRCECCLLPRVNCICHAKPSVCCNSAFLFLMYSCEYFKPSNTGRLIAEVAQDNHAFIWSRTQPEKALLDLLNDPQYQPVLIFPTQYAVPARCIDQPLENDKKILFILLDGTWREAKKMFKNSPYLNGFPVMGIQPTQASNYRLREAAHLHQLCTAEVVIEVLKIINDPAASQLADFYDTFCKSYLIGKPHLNSPAD